MFNEYEDGYLILSDGYDTGNGVVLGVFDNIYSLKRGLMELFINEKITWDEATFSDITCDGDTANCNVDLTSNKIKEYLSMLSSKIASCSNVQALNARVKMATIKPIRINELI